jgi:hypothetical protein
VSYIVNTQGAVFKETSTNVWTSTYDTAAEFSIASSGEFWRISKNDSTLASYDSVAGTWTTRASGILRMDMDTETGWVIDSSNVIKTITKTGTVVKTYVDKAVEIAAKKGDGSIFHINNAEFATEIAARDGAGSVFIINNTERAFYGNSV